MSIIIYVSLPAPTEISFKGCSQSYKNDFPLTTVEGKDFGKYGRQGTLLMLFYKLINITLII